MKGLAIKFDEPELWLLVEALSRFQPEAPADRLKVVRMRDLIENELTGGGRR
jgi:hypothetical protein